MRAWTVLFLVAFLVAPAAARTETRTYEATLYGVAFHQQDSMLGWTSDGEWNFGVVWVPTEASDTTATIQITDTVRARFDPANATSVPAAVCQDTNQDQSCDRWPDPPTFCGRKTLGFGTRPGDFVAGIPLIVYVHPVETKVPIPGVVSVGVGVYAPCDTFWPQSAFQGRVTVQFS